MYLQISAYISMNIIVRNLGAILAIIVPCHRLPARRQQHGSHRLLDRTLQPSSPTSSAHRHCAATLVIVRLCRLVVAACDNMPRLSHFLIKYSTEYILTLSLNIALPKK
jgi:hypothetical protein